MITSDITVDVRPEPAGVVSALTPDGPAGASHADSDLRVRAESLLGKGPVGWAVQVARRTCDMVVAQGFDGDDPPVDQIAEACESTLLVLLLRLSGRFVAPVAVTARQSEIVRYRISRRNPFHQVVASQRLIQHHWADLLLREAARSGAGPQAMLTITATLDRYFDDVIDWHLRFYLAEQERFAHSETRERARLIETLVAGLGVDPADARRRLGVDLAGDHVALVVADAGERESDAEERMARALLALGRVADHVLAHRPAAGPAWIWLDGRAAGRLDTVETLLRDAGIRAGVGGRYRGAPGFRRSHLEAGEALRFARHRGIFLLRHRDVALAALLSTDLERARWFVRSELGGLARADAKSVELRDTLSEYYRAGTRLSVAAAALHVHRNTLLYRLRHIAELLGRPVADMTPETQCALLLAAEFGDAVLDASAPDAESPAQLRRLTALHVG